jgi:hypothetical protein
LRQRQRSAFRFEQRAQFFQLFCFLRFACTFTFPGNDSLRLTLAPFHNLSNFQQTAPLQFLKQFHRKTELHSCSQCNRLLFFEKHKQSARFLSATLGHEKIRALFLCRRATRACQNDFTLR